MGNNSICEIPFFATNPNGATEFWIFTPIVRKSLGQPHMRNNWALAKAVKIKFTIFAGG